MRYVWKMGADNRAFAAALVDMGVRGHVRLVEEDGGWFSRDKTRLERLTSDPAPARRRSGARQARADRRIDHHGAEEPRQIRCRKEGLETILKSAVRRQAVQPQLGLGGRRRAVFVAALWLAAAAVVAATAALRSAVARARRAGHGRAAARWSSMASTAGKCLVSLSWRVLRCVAVALGVPILGRR